jgi:hypothetical protein
VGPVNDVALQSVADRVPVGLINPLSEQVIRIGPMSVPAEVHEELELDVVRITEDDFGPNKVTTTPVGCIVLRPVNVSALYSSITVNPSTSCHH